jgi:Ca2+-binding RTX toxin-like protein
MSDTTSATTGFKINPALILKASDLIDEARSMPVEEFDLGNGLGLQRQGMIIKFTGDKSRLSPGAMIAALQAMEMGGKAGQNMFETFRKTNPEDFDGSQSLDAILSKANLGGPRPTPSADDHKGELQSLKDGETLDASESEDAVKVSGGNNVEIKGSAQDDFLEALRDVRAWGNGGNDTIRAGDGAWIDGGDGDDQIWAHDNATILGGAGNDHIAAYNNLTADGGDGNDRISGYDNLTADGGAGDDHVTGGDNATVTDARGDNYVSVQAFAQVTAGKGDDWIEAGADSTLTAGDGDNFLSSYDRSTVVSGRGSDLIKTGDDSVVISGGGDDVITVGTRGVVEAGTGNDQITVGGAAVIRFNRGDGQDVIAGGKRGYAFTETARLSSSTVAFGAGISMDDLEFQARGNDLTITIRGGEDRLTIADYQRHGIPTLSFGDGSMMSSADVTAAVGPGEAYQPVSQVLQNWHDANAAYRTAQAKASGATQTSGQTTAAVSA